MSNNQNTFSSKEEIKFRRALGTHFQEEWSACRLTVILLQLLLFIILYFTFSSLLFYTLNQQSQERTCYRNMLLRCSGLTAMCREAESALKWNKGKFSEIILLFILQVYPVYSSSSSLKEWSSLFLPWHWVRVYSQNSHFDSSKFQGTHIPDKRKIIQ